jgi:hypothetical protein
MQLADDVERRSTVSRRPQRPPRIPSSAAVTWPPTAVSFPPAMLAFCASLAIRSPSPNSHSLPMTPNIYYQQQPCLTNNFQVFTKCGTNATNIGRSLALRGDIKNHCWLLLIGAGKCTAG